jgi:GNAT superfamily N-acetyltransferase
MKNVIPTDKNKNINIRNGKPSDHEKVISIMPEWWGGRDLSSSVLKIFFIHFSNTIYIAEIDTDLMGFLVGFFSQSEENTAYIHFVGVHPDLRKAGLGRLLYQNFFNACIADNRNIIKSCTSPINKLSINFHLHMGFTIEPGDIVVDHLPASANFLRNNDPKVLFKKVL